MVDFTLSEEQLNLREMAHGFAAKEIRPIAWQYDRVRKGGKWVINGSKVFITNGEYANRCTVHAKTDRAAGHRGISAFVVPRDAGVIVDKHEHKVALRASNTVAITFEDCEIPADHLLGQENHGFKLAMMTLDRTRPGVAALATGIGRAAMEFAVSAANRLTCEVRRLRLHQGVQGKKLMRDAKIMQLYEGTPQIQGLVIARETLVPRHLDQPAAAA